MDDEDNQNRPPSKWPKGPRLPDIVGNSTFRQNIDALKSDDDRLVLACLRKNRLAFFATNDWDWSLQQQKGNLVDIKLICDARQGELDDDAPDDPVIFIKPTGNKDVPTPGDMLSIKITNCVHVPACPFYNEIELQKMQQLQAAKVTADLTQAYKDSVLAHLDLMHPSNVEAGVIVQLDPPGKSAKVMITSVMAGSLLVWAPNPQKPGCLFLSHIKPGAQGNHAHKSWTDRVLETCSMAGVPLSNLVKQGQVWGPSNYGGSSFASEAVNGSCLVVGVWADTEGWRLFAQKVNNDNELIGARKLWPVANQKFLSVKTWEDFYDDWHPGQSWAQGKDGWYILKDDEE